MFRDSKVVCFFASRENVSFFSPYYPWMLQRDYSHLLCVRLFVSKGKNIETDWKRERERGKRGKNVVVVVLIIIIVVTICLLDEFDYHHQYKQKNNYYYYYDYYANKYNIIGHIVIAPAKAGVRLFVLFIIFVFFSSYLIVTRFIVVVFVIVIVVDVVVVVIIYID